MSRKESKRLSSVEDSVDASIGRLELHKKAQSKTDYCDQKKKVKTMINRATITKQQKCEEKQS